VVKTSKYFIHPYIPNSVPEIREEMLKEIGVNSVEELFTDIPEEIKLKKELNIPNSISENQIKDFIELTLSKNITASEIPTFLGAGCWPHYIPAVVNEIVNRSELKTSYTPYQPETSQGLLQALFEYQSLICELTGMDYANCSLYDWSTSLGESARMVTRITRKNEFIVPHFINPERLATLMTYAEPVGIKIVQTKQNKITGQTDLTDLEKKLSNDTAGVYLENPSYLGYYELGVETISEIAHKHDALFVIGVDPISLGILEPPSNYGADIVIGEGQPLGNEMNYGGPLLGIFGCRGEKLLRQMPGRIVGMTTTIKEAHRAYCMVLQTREQHIRREKATSNICSNEALCAIATATYLSLLGPIGLRNLCETIITKSHYAMKKLNDIKGIKAPLIEAQHFKEFTINFNETGKKVEEVHKKLLKYGIHGGKILKHDFAELGETALYCFTEIHSQQDIDKLVETIEKVLR